MVNPILVGDADDTGPELALVQVTDPNSLDLPPMGLAAGNRDNTWGDSVERCHTVGYRNFMERTASEWSQVRDTVDVVGHVPVLSSLATGCCRWR
jgi:hypothetical protein